MISSDIKMISATQKNDNRVHRPLKDTCFLKRSFCGSPQPPPPDRGSHSSQFIHKSRRDVGGPVCTRTDTFAYIHCPPELYAYVEQEAGENFFVLVLYPPRMGLNYSIISTKRLNIKIYS